MTCFQRSTAYLIGLAQLVIMCGMVLFYPTVSIQLLVYHPTVSNGTLNATQRVDVQPSTVLLGLPCILTAAATTAFVSSTFSITDSGGLGEETYCQDNMRPLAVWDALFWFLVACVHCTAILAIATPTDVFAATVCTYLTVHYLKRLCAPVDPENVTLTMANTNILGYITGLLTTVYCCPVGYQNRYTIAFVLGVIDYFLGIGHTWDRSVNMDTIANCRLFWACSASIGLAALYGAWHDEVLASIAQY